MPESDWGWEPPCPWGRRDQDQPGQLPDLQAKKTRAAAQRASPAMLQAHLWRSHRQVSHGRARLTGRMQSLSLLRCQGSQEPDPHPVRSSLCISNLEG